MKIYLNQIKQKRNMKFQQKIGLHTFGHCIDFISPLHKMTLVLLCVMLTLNALPNNTDNGNTDTPQSEIDQAWLFVKKSDTRSVLSYEDSMLNGFDLLKSSEDQEHRPDSMYEYYNHGYVSESLKWYFKYDNIKKSTYVTRKWYNSDNENILDEYRHYNNNGQLLSNIAYIRNMKQWHIDGDTSKEESYNEQNIYEGGLLIEKKVKNPMSLHTDVDHIFYPYDLNDKYIYDSTGKCVQKVTTYFSSTNDTFLYFYNTEGNLTEVYKKGYDNLKYSLTEKYTYDENNNILTKIWKITNYYARTYSYVITDSSIQTIEYEFEDILFDPTDHLDSLTSWGVNREKHEIFDNLDRLKTRHIKYQNTAIEPEVVEEYTTNYSYYDNNKIKEVYTNVTVLNNRPVNIRTKSLFKYTEEGNSLYYEKTFYDDRFNEWVVNESKTYFYPELSTTIMHYKNRIKTKELAIYPNPASDKIYIQEYYGENLLFSIFNVQGVNVKKGILNIKAIDIAGLKPGMYVIKINDKQKVYHGRFLIER